MQNGRDPGRRTFLALTAGTGALGTGVSGTGGCVGVVLPEQTEPPLPPAPTGAIHDTREPATDLIHDCLQGPTVLLEFDNSRNGGPHSHSVRQEFGQDFGGEVG